MFAPHTVTLYNTITAIDAETFEDFEQLCVTVLRGVLCDAAKAVNVRTSGLDSADAVNLYIPFTVEAVDGHSGAVKRFAKPQEFAAADDKSELWTLAIDGQNGISTFFVKGEFVTDNKYVALQHDDCYNLTKIDEKDFGSSAMQHWECGGA